MPADSENNGTARSEASEGGESVTVHEDDTTDVEEEDHESDDNDENGSEDDGEDEEDEDDEPKLKYARMTSHLLPVYRNGDATSTFLVAGDKMVVGTHNGNVHITTLPSFQPLRVYHAHAASITSLSISPFPPPLPTPSNGRPEPISRVGTQMSVDKPGTITSRTGSQRAPRQQQTLVPRIPSNDIYIATSSIDGNVVVQSLVDARDVQQRNFARPVQAVALSPDYKNDRAYLSGGLAGNLVLTIGGRAGTSATSTTTGTASAAASGWLGTIGLGGNTGKDTILHSGEGAVSTIKWSLTGKYVVWVNEHGIKIMRSNLHLDSADAEFAWKRIAHVDRPDEPGWEEMASVWKARAEWIDEANLESDDDDETRGAMSEAAARLKSQEIRSKKRIEKLVVGWGSSVWIINVHPGGVGVGRHVGERSVGRAEISKILRMDCIVSGLSLYTPTLLLILAYLTPDDDDEDSSPPTPKGHKSKLSTASSGSEPSGGIHRRQNAQPPELRLIDLATSEEVDTDGLTVSRFERLTARDYHLGVLPAVRAGPIQATSRGTLETLAGMGSGVWNASINATMSATTATLRGTTALISSSASIFSANDSDNSSSTQTPSTTSAARQPAHPNIATQGMKIFIHSPYDCILATKRDLSDHLSFLLELKRYEKAWHLVDNHPEVISSSPERLAEIGPGTPDRASTSHDDFYDDVTSTADSASKLINSSVEKEKRRIGELWIQQLVSAGEWTTAGQICGKVLGTSTRWEHWVWNFASAKKFDEITNYIPTTQMQPPLPSSIYEVVLGHYIANDRMRLKELLERWPSDLFDIKAVTDALENQLKYRDVRIDSVEDGIPGRDWKIVQESLGKLYVAGGRPREALKCYFNLHNADEAMNLIKEYHLVDAVEDDIPGFIMLRVSPDQAKTAPRSNLEQATSEAISLLVDEAQHGLVRPDIVVSQLQEANMPLYLFFYLRSLWRGQGLEDHSDEAKEHLVVESKSLVDEHADLAIDLFASYDRPLLMEVLRNSTTYSIEEACVVCEELDYIPELVYLYSKTGDAKRALFLIIDRLADVSQAINFAKSQDDRDLWNDLLDYSMDKPRFIRGLLEEVGTSIDPVTLVRRIPSGLEIEGLRDGLSRMIKEHELQWSISEGVAGVLRGEVATAQRTLRAGQRKGIKFDVVHHKGHSNDLKVATSDIPTDIRPLSATKVPGVLVDRRPKPGCCVGCHESFLEEEVQTLIGFACGHVFHLSCLLAYEHPDIDAKDVDGDGRRDLVDEEGEYLASHTVGAKVTHAALLRGKINDGCPVCVGSGSKGGVRVGP